MTISIVANGVETVKVLAGAWEMTKSVFVECHNRQMSIVLLLLKHQS
jgi:hypothetical protein